MPRKRTPIPQAEVSALIRRIGQRLRELREANDLTVYAVGQATGMNRGIIGRIETDRNEIKLGSLIKIAHLMRVKPSAILRSVGL